MVEKQVKKPSAGYAVFVAIIGVMLIAALFGDFQMSFSGQFSRVNFIDLIRVVTQLFPKISAGGDDLKTYLYENFEALLYVVAIVGCLVTYFVHIVRYIIAAANFKEEKDTRRMTSNLAGFTYTGLIFSALSFLLSFRFGKGTDNSISADMPGWGGLLAMLASIIGFIVLTVKAGKDERKVGVLKTFGALTVLFVSLCGLLTYGSLLTYGGYFVTPIRALKEALYGHLTNEDPITPVIYAGAGILLAGATLILYKGIVRNVLETKTYFKEEKEKKYNPHVRILVYVLVATVLYAGGIVMYILAKVPGFELSYFVYIAGGLHILPLIFAICYIAKYGKNRPLPVVQPKKEESEEESSLEEEAPVEEVKAEEQPTEEVKEEEKEEPEVEAEPEEEKPQPGYFDFFKPVSKSATNDEELNEPKPEEDIPVYQEVSPSEKEAIQEDDEKVEEPVSEVAPVAPVVEEAPAEEAKAEEQPVEEATEEVVPAKKAAPKKSKEGEKKESPKKPAGEKKDTPTYRTYHLVKRDDGKWEVKFAGGQKAIKLFNTQKEAVEYAKVLAENQGGTYLIHNSKGANKGRIQKK